MRVLSLLLFLLAPCWARAQSAEAPLVFGCVDFPPYCYADAQGQAGGHIVGFFQQLAERAGLRVTFLSQPYPRLVQSIRAGQIQLSVGAEDNPVARLGALSRHVLFESRLCLYPRPGLEHSALPDRLQGERLLLIHGSLYPGERAQALLNDPDRHWQLSHAPTHEAALGMLERGRADYLLDYDEVVRRLSLAGGEKVPDCLPVEQVNLRYVVLLGAGAAEQVRDALDAAFSELADEGRLPGWVTPPGKP